MATGYWLLATGYWLLARKRFMRKSKMAKTSLDKEIADLVSKTDKKSVVSWACDCAEHVLPYFEKTYPNDPRPRQAIEAGRTWVRTGIFHIKDIRNASLSSHAAARDIADGDPAHSAARSAGQAVAATHVPAHAIAAAIYAATAVRDAFEGEEGESAALKEREWQRGRLRASC